MIGRNIQAEHDSVSAAPPGLHQREGPLTTADLIFAEPLDAVVPDLAGVQDQIVLDVGCGSGTVGTRLAESGLLVIGLDIDQAALARARKAAEVSGVADRVFLMMASTEAIPLRAESVDNVFSKSTMQYVDQARAFAECGRVLRDAGTLVMIENLAYNPFVSVFRVGRRFLRRSVADTAYINSIRGYVTMPDLESLGQSLGSARLRSFHLTRAASLILLARFPESSWLRKVDGLLGQLDNRLVERLPSLARLAWIVAFVGRKSTGLGPNGIER